MYYCIDDTIIFNYNFNLEPDDKLIDIISQFKIIKFMNYSDYYFAINQHNNYSSGEYICDCSKNCGSSYEYAGQIYYCKYNKKCCLSRFNQPVDNLPLGIKKIFLVGVLINR